MMKQSTIQRVQGLVAVAAAALLLSACSSEPSNGDIEQAVKASVTKSQEAMSKLASSSPQAAEMAKKMMPTVHGVNKIGCKADGDKAYNCDVELDMETGITGRKKQTVPVRMVKGSEGWTLSGM